MDAELIGAMEELARLYHDATTATRPTAAADHTEETGGRAATENEGLSAMPRPKPKPKPKPEAADYYFQKGSKKSKRGKGSKPKKSS